MSPQPDDRSALSIGLDWGARITSIGLEFAVPAVLGFGLDRWLNTSPWMTVGGSFLGLAVGILHMVRLAQSLPRDGPGVTRRSRRAAPKQPAPRDDDLTQETEGP